jgi:peroxiredoxin Q/BCP
MALKPGDLAPDFTLMTHERKPQSLAELRGQKEYFDQCSVAVLGASFDSIEDNAAFARKYDFNFPLLCDVQRTLGMAYGACNNPQARHAARISVLIDESGKIARIYTQVNPRDHASQVLADLIDG